MKAQGSASARTNENSFRKGAAAVVFCWKQADKCDKGYPKQLFVELRGANLAVQLDLLDWSFQALEIFLENPRFVSFAASPDVTEASQRPFERKE